jgi:hypothetical protein
VQDHAHGHPVAQLALEPASLAVWSFTSSDSTKVSTSPPRAGCPGARRVSAVTLSRFAARPESVTNTLGVLVIFDVRLPDHAGTWAGDYDPTRFDLTAANAAVAAI